MSNATVIATSPGMEYANLASLKGCLKMEARGMYHSRLGKIRKKVAVMMGLKPNTKIEQVIEAVQAKMDTLLAEKQAQPA